MDIDGPVAIVTGAGSGLGNATARALHCRGARVVLLDLPSSDGEAAARAIGGEARFVPADVTSTDDVAAAVELAASLGDLRIVVNCAGVVNREPVLGKNGVVPLETFENVVRINLVGTLNVIRLAVEKIAATDAINGERGVIIDTASVAAFEGQIGHAAGAPPCPPRQDGGPVIWAAAPPTAAARGHNPGAR